MAGIISILTEFDAIMDTDLTVMKILQRKYNNPKYIKQDVMCLPLSDLKKKICEREHECPVSICMDDIDKSIELYKLILEKETEDMYKYLMPTGLFKLMELFVKTDGYSVTVICKDEDQRDFIKEVDPKFKTIMEKDWKKINTDPYGVFFLKSIMHIFSFEKKFEKKYFIIMKYAFNLTKDPNDGTLFPNSAIGALLVPANRLGLVEVYSSK